MCDAKGALYNLVQHDSQNAAHVGNMIGGKVGQVIQNEGEYNEQNPGHAVTKAAETAASMYLAGLLGAGSAAGDTGVAATDSAESGGTLALNAGGSAVTPYASSALAGSDLLAGGSAAGGSMTGAQAADMALQGGLDPETQAGMGGMGVAQQGIGPGTLADQSQGAINNPSSLLSPNGMPANAARNFMGGGSGARGPMGRMAMQMGSRMMTPQQPPPPPMSRPPSGAPPGPLATPYGQNSGPYGTPAGNSLGIPSGGPPPPSSGLPQSLPPEVLQRLRMLGYQV